MSQCLNSDKGNGANNAVTLNGITYHSIIGCQNKDKSYRTDLVDADKAYDTLKGLIDPILVPVNSLDDSAVWSDYKTCAYTNGLVDPAKSSDKQGDIGHKYHLVNCDTTAHKNLLVADINAYIAKPSSKDIILTQYSIDNDASLEQAVADCGGGFELGGSSLVVAVMVFLLVLLLVMVMLLLVVVMVMARIAMPVIFRQKVLKAD